MEIDKLFGLPAHPFLVHAPLVLIPVLALAVVALVARPGLRERGALPLAAGAIVVAGLCVLAAGSGEEFERRVVETALVEEHAELGDQLQSIALVLAGVVVVWVGVLRYGSRVPWTTRLATPLAALAVVMALTATVWDVRTGHAGAKAAWKKAGDAPLQAEREGAGG